MAEIKTFRDLQVWKKSHILVLEVYKITKVFPNDERYVLVSQLRRAVLSIASNIVEGFSRLSVKESLRFYDISKGSLEEVKYQLLVSRDLDYINKEVYTKIIDLSEEVGKMLNGWLKSQKNNYNK